MGQTKKSFELSFEWHYHSQERAWLDAHMLKLGEGNVLCDVCGWFVRKGARHKVTGGAISSGKHVIYYPNGLERAKKIAQKKKSSIIVENTQEGSDCDEG